MSAPLSALPLVTTLTDNSRLYAFDESAPPGSGSKAITVGDARALLGGGGAPIVTAKIIYVATNGDDTTGDGTQAKPVLSIAAALVLADPTDPAAPWVISVGPGNFPDAYMFKADCYIVGSGRNVTKLAGPSVFAGANWGMGNCTVLNYITVAGVDVGRGDTRPRFWDVDFVGTVDIQLEADDCSVNFWGCNFQDITYHLTGGFSFFHFCNMAGVNIGDGANADQIGFYAYFCRLSDILVNGTATGACYALLEGCSAVSLSIFDPNAIAQIYNQTVIGEIYESNGAQLEYNTPQAAASLAFESATGMGWPDPAPRNVRDALDYLAGYTPAVPGDWIAPAPDTIPAALDQLAARSPSFRAVWDFEVANTGSPVDLAEFTLPAGLTQWTPGDYYFIVIALAGVITAGNIELWTGPNGTGNKLNGGTGALTGLTAVGALKAGTIAVQSIVQTAPSIFIRQVQNAVGTGTLRAILIINDLTTE